MILISFTTFNSGSGDGEDEGETSDEMGFASNGPEMANLM